jgi:(S)-2-hydroxy-acid oxidase
MELNVRHSSWDSLPPPHRLANYDDETSIRPLEHTYNGRTHASWDQNSEHMFEQNVTWDDVRWLKSQGCAGLPLIVKGILTPHDAICAVQAGADAVMVSNHGGRQLDGCLASLDALPAVVQAVGHVVPVLLDGGVRRGTDILKALALGASAVGIGKPVFFALAVGGEQGVRDMLTILQRELESAMALCGCASIQDVTRELVMRHPYGNPPPQYIPSAL